MNKVLLAINGVLLLAVGYLFYKVSGSSSTQSENDEKTEISKKPVLVEKKDVPVTGKIAFVNIDSLNEQSLYVDYMIKKLKSSRASIEASVESLSIQYQNKVKEYQSSASAGIAPESELAMKAKEIQAIEREVQNKQVQMDNLAMEMNDKNNAFQNEVRRFIQEKYEGKFDYVLTFSESIPSMLYGNSALDITHEVIVQLNEDYKNKTKK
ncbi:MAG: OmpH family outer membrane protein [Sphingobacteriaceae bacterium]